jgi:hypothetical protein
MGFCLCYSSNAIFLLGGYVMKKFFKAIGGFFVRIWRWIKNTAWIQPLLIVGLIFAVIFSITPIYNGIKDLNDKRNSPDAYYRKYQVSLKAGENSDAQKLLDEIYANENGMSTSMTGQKFFLSFVQGDSKCSACDSAQEGFSKLESYSKDKLGGNAFNLKTIFVDEETKEDWKKDDNKMDDECKSAFDALLVRNILYFEEYAGSAQNSNYFINDGIDESTILKIQEANVDTFLTPTIILVDFTDDVTAKGVQTAFISVKGSNSVQKAEFLLDAWLYRNDFGEK